MLESLSRILFPREVDFFLRHYQAREYFYLGRNAPDHYEYLLSAADVDLYLQSQNLPAAFLNVVKNGKEYPLEQWSQVDTSARGEHRLAVPEKLFNLYSEGATLILSSAERAIPSLNHLCRTLAVELGFPVHANVYVTPRSAAGFAKHADNHEVLVAQIAGNKEWLLELPDSSIAEIDLRSGDLLYLPRGLSHAAKAGEQDSIHVTLGLRPIYAFQLIEDLAAVASADTEFQRPLPPRFAGHEARQAFEGAFLRNLSALAIQLTPAELLERRIHGIAANQTAGWPDRLSDLRAIGDMTIGTIVCRRLGIFTLVKPDGRFFKVEFADKRILVPQFLRDALDKIIGEQAFAIGEIAGLIDSVGKVRLVAEFVRAGLLRIVSI